jgi:hypothetical protein
MRKTIGIILLAISLTAAAPSSYVTFPARMTYSEVRSKLTKQGWLPLQVTTAEQCQRGSGRACPSALEAVDCGPGEGQWVCRYAWRRKTQTSLVSCIGDGVQRECSSLICPRPLRLEGEQWVCY